MTMPQLPGQGLPPLFDAGNSLLNKVPSNLVTGKVQGPQGEMGVVTIRSPDVTLTVLLDKAEAEDWARVFADLAGQLSGSKLIVPSGGQAQQIASAARSARRNANGQP